MERRLDRRLVALAAAYAVALNALLPVLTLVLLPAVSRLGPAVICSAAGAGVVRLGSASGSGAPEEPRPLCPCPGVCPMTGCAAAALPGTDAIAAVAWPSAGPLGLRRDGGGSLTFRLDGHNLARGPPVA